MKNLILLCLFALTGCASSYQQRCAQFEKQVATTPWDQLPALFYKVAQEPHVDPHWYANAMAQWTAENKKRVAAAAKQQEEWNALPYAQKVQLQQQQQMIALQAQQLDWQRRQALMQSIQGMNATIQQNNANQAAIAAYNTRTMMQSSQPLPYQPRSTVNTAPQPTFYNGTVTSPNGTQMATYNGTVY